MAGWELTRDIASSFHPAPAPIPASHLSSMTMQFRPLGSAEEFKAQGSAPWWAKSWSVDEKHNISWLWLFSIRRLIWHGKSQSSTLGSNHPNTNVFTPNQQLIHHHYEVLLHFRCRTLHGSSFACCNPPAWSCLHPYQQERLGIRHRIPHPPFIYLQPIGGHCS